MTALDPADPGLALVAPGLLGVFNRAGVVSAADLQVARRLGRLTGEADETVLLAVALAVRGLRSGSVCIRPAALEDLAVPEGEAAAGPGDADETLPWPDTDVWLQAVAASPMVHCGPDEPDPPRPVRLVADRLYLDRYLRDERAVRDEIDRRAAASMPVADERRLTDVVRRWFPGADDERQREACRTAARGLLTVVTGGPGTGKTTAITRLLAVLHELDPAAELRVALAAPTGKAAARLTEAVAEQLADLEAAGVAVPSRLGRPVATTVHRLLGTSPGSSTRFRHDRRHRLPHDVLVVDETSMVSLPLMARLLEALRPDARLVLVGDPDQLASVEAGAVLADVVARLRAGAATRGAVVPLEVVHRFGGTIAALAAAVRDGDSGAALAVLRSGDAAAELIVPGRSGFLEGTRQDVASSALQRLAAAGAGDATAALTALGTHRLLVAHRRGPFGLRRWSAQVLQWEAEAGLVPLPTTPGASLLVTANDPGTGLANGDTGVVLPRTHGSDGTRVGVFGHPNAPVTVPLHRLGDVEPLHALTVHRSQGSQYDVVTLVLPPADSPLLTRELLYTAVTRARHRVRVIGDADAVAAAIARPVRRASGLRDGPGDGGSVVEPQ